MDNVKLSAYARMLIREVSSESENYESIVLLKQYVAHLEKKKEMKKKDSKE